MAGDDGMTTPAVRREQSREMKILMMNDLMATSRVGVGTYESDEDCLNLIGKDVSL